MYQYHVTLNNMPTQMQQAAILCFLTVLSIHSLVGIVFNLNFQFKFVYTIMGVQLIFPNKIFSLKLDKKEAEQRFEVSSGLVVDPQKMLKILY